MWGVGDRGYRPARGFWKRQGRFLLVAWLVLEALYLKLGARADEARFVPTVQRFAALEKGRDCRVYRDLALRAKRDLVAQERALVTVDEALRLRRQALEQCGGANGIREVSSEEEDAHLAETCPMAYEAWLRPGFRREILKEDLRETKKALSTLTSVLEGCGGKL